MRPLAALAYVLLDDGKLSVLSTMPERPRPVAESHSGDVEVVLLASDGERLAAVRVPDPRTLVSEVNDGSGYVRREATLPFGGMRVSLPAADGTVVVFGADGEELGRAPVFAEQVDAIVAELTEREDFQDVKDRFFISRLDVVSREDEIDDPDAGTDPDTAFETGFGEGALRRAVWFRSAEGTAAALDIVSRLALDVLVVLVNDTEHGGGAIAPLVTVTLSDPADVVMHELAHALFGIADEYSGGGIDCNPRVAPNIATSAAREDLPWASLVREDVPLPTPSDLAGEYASSVGAFEGGQYCDTGVRPTLSCTMRHGDTILCPVCRCRMRTVACMLDEPSGVGCELESVCPQEAPPPRPPATVTTAAPAASPSQVTSTGRGAGRETRR